MFVSQTVFRSEMSTMYCTASGWRLKRVTGKPCQSITRVQKILTATGGGGRPPEIAKGEGG